MTSGQGPQVETLPRPGHRNASHHVQFYVKDALMLDQVGRFLKSGLEAGEAGIVIGTPAHNEGLRTRLGPSAKACVFLEASETMNGFLDGDGVDLERFEATVGDTVRAASRRGNGRVRAFGEMVAMLCAQGRPRTAVELERVWNGLAGSVPLTLLCAYPMSAFPVEADRGTFTDVCNEHAVIEPMDGTPNGDAAARIVQLQQELHALRQEMARQQALATRDPRDEALRDFIEQAPVGMHKVDAKGTILWANRRELELLGYKREEYVGRNVFAFHDDPEVPRLVISKAMQGQQVHNVRSQMRRKDGSFLPVLIDSNGVFHDGRFLRSRCIVRPLEDLVAIERREAEGELQRNRDHLEALVQERTQRLEQANRELDAFSSAVSHDLRGPVRAIAGFSALLAQRHAGRIDPHGRELLEEVRRAAARMGDLIEDLLDLSRADRLLPNRAAVDLSRLAEEILRIEAERQPSRHVHCDVDPDLVVQGDPDLLRMAMENLLSNAWKFTSRAKEARISVSRRREGEDVVLCVQDNGAGFDMADAGRLFQPFQRLHRRSEYDGTGIGLATVRRIIERHGGRIWAQGKPGAGAAFYFTLPNAPQPVPPAPNPPLPPLPRDAVTVAETPRLPDAR